MKVALFGTYPPPIGGTSIYIKRLADFLSDNNINIAVYDTHGNGIKDKNYVKKIRYNKKWLIRYLFTISEDIIHSHTHSWKDRAALVFISRMRRKKIIFTFHSLREERNDLTIFEKILVKYVLKKSNIILTAGENERNKLLKWGGINANVRVIPTFIPPKREKFYIPMFIKKFINAHKIIITANGSNMNFYKGDDLYGLDMFIDLCAKLKKDYDIGFIYCLTEITDKNYYNKIINLINDFKLQDNFILVNENIELWPIIEKSNLFIRPSNSDGDSISVREALYYRVPVIASDVIIRPEGIILFKSRDNKDLYNKVVSVLDNYNIIKEKIVKIKAKDYAREILEIYKQIV